MRALLKTSESESARRLSGHKTGKKPRNTTVFLCFFAVFLPRKSAGIFKQQVFRSAHNSLISQLDIIADEARNISGGAGGLTNDDEGDLPDSRYGRCHKRMEEYAGILKMELPGLLRQKFEEFSKPKSAGFLRKLHEMFFLEKLLSFY